MSFKEPSFATLIIPANSEEEAKQFAKDMTKNLSDVEITQCVDVSIVDGMEKQVKRLSTNNVVGFKSNKDLN